MNAAYEKLIQHLDQRSVKYLVGSDGRAIWADFRGDVGMYRVVASVDPDDGLFQVFAHAPVRVPAGCRPAVAETIARGNFGLKVGKLELDFDEGDLRFHASHILSSDDLDDEVISRLLGTSITMLNLYLPAVLSVIYGNELPQDAIRCVEGSMRQADEAGGE